MFSLFNPTDYNGGRSASDIVAAGMELFESVRDPPELRQLVDQEIFDDKCNSAQLCLIFAIFGFKIFKLNSCHSILKF